MTRHYDDVLDDIILRAKQAQDYFLLVGPPGTGKTSRALKFMVEEALNDGTGMPTAESIAAGGKGGSAASLIHPPDELYQPSRG